MNPEAIILKPDATVAEAIARLRDTDLPPAISVRLFVTETPTQAPTGRYLGSVTLPRLLQEPPANKVGDCINREEPTLRPSASEQEVASLLARYDLLAVAVVDPLERLVGVITVDDVVIRLIERVNSMKVRDNTLTRPGKVSGSSPNQDKDVVGMWSENQISVLGTGKYLAIQTLVVIAWITVNAVAGANGLWDEYPFILLNLLQHPSALMQHR